MSLRVAHSTVALLAIAVAGVGCQVTAAREEAQPLDSPKQVAEPALASQRPVSVTLQLDRRAPGWQRRRISWKDG